MPETYKIITDEAQLATFIDWLPELKPDGPELYYCCLLARAKYVRDLDPSLNLPHIKTDKEQLKRFTATKSNLLHKIKQLEIPIGLYKHKDVTPIPQEALALYITITPRDIRAAYVQLAKKCIDVVTSFNQKKNVPNPHQDALSCIQQSKAKGSGYIVFDIDTKNADFSKLSDILDEGSYSVIETRGGFHLLVNPRKVKVHTKTFYQALKKEYDYDVIGDTMSPVPGTYQGGFTPKFTVIDGKVL